MEKLPGVKIIKVNKEDIKNSKANKQIDLEQQLQKAINKKDQKTIDAIITKLSMQMKQAIEEMQHMLSGTIEKK